MRRQGCDGYERADIISSDTHCAALCRGGAPGSGVGIDLVNRGPIFGHFAAIDCGFTSENPKQNSVGDLIKTQKRE